MTTTAPVTLILTETDDLDAPEVFRGVLSECKAHAAAGLFFARRADDGRILFRLGPDSLTRLAETRAVAEGKIVERQIKPAACRLIARVFDTGAYDLELFSDKNFHHIAQQRAVKKAGLKISKYGGNVEVSSAQAPALVAALRGEGFEVVGYHGEPL